MGSESDSSSYYSGNVGWWVNVDKNRNCKVIGSYRYVDTPPPFPVVIEILSSDSDVSHCQSDSSLSYDSSSDEGGAAWEENLRKKQKM